MLDWIHNSRESRDYRLIKLGFNINEVKIISLAETRKMATKTLNLTTLTFLTLQNRVGQQLDKSITKHNINHLNL